MDAKCKGVNYSLRLSPHKILINHKDRKADIMLEKKGRHQFNQMIKFDNTSVQQAGIACPLMWCAERATIFLYVLRVEMGKIGRYCAKLKVYILKLQRSWNTENTEQLLRLKEIWIMIIKCNMLSQIGSGTRRKKQKAFDEAVGMDVIAIYGLDGSTVSILISWFG